MTEWDRLIRAPQDDRERSVVYRDKASLYLDMEGIRLPRRHRYTPTIPHRLLATTGSLTPWAIRHSYVDMEGVKLPRAHSDEVWIRTSNDRDLAIKLDEGFAFIF
jgi:hypothetical protein